MSVVLPPSYWGDAFWKMLYTIAYSYNENDGANASRDHVIKFYSSLAELLPCESCREHYKLFIIERPIETVLTTRSELLSWVNDLNNRVNQIVGSGPTFLHKKLAEMDNAAQVKRSLTIRTLSLRQQAAAVIARRPRQLATAPRQIVRRGPPLPPKQQKLPNPQIRAKPTAPARPTRVAKIQINRVAPGAETARQRPRPLAQATRALPMNNKIGIKKTFIVPKKGCISCSKKKLRHDVIAAATAVTPLSRPTIEYPIPAATMVPSAPTQLWRHDTSPTPEN